MGGAMVMSARVRLENVLTPVLTASDDAEIACAASRILRDQTVREIEVVPLTQASELTNATFYAIRAGALEWCAVRLLIAQCKLRGDVRLPVRIVMNDAQWRRAGLVAHVAEAANGSV